MARPVRIPRLRRIQVPAWASAVCRWFRLTGLHLHEIQLREWITRAELLGDADTDPAFLPLLRARLAEVRAEVAALEARP